MLKKLDYVILSACDSKHSPYLISALFSFRKVYKSLPNILIYDLGLTKSEIKEIESFGAQIKQVNPKSNHYFNSWTWKLDIITEVNFEIVLYMDLPNFLILRKLDRFINLIEKNGYFLVSIGHKLGQQTPYDYWDLFNLNQESYYDQLVFGAGLMGVCKSHKAYKAFLLANQFCLKGYNLGSSKGELNPRYSSKILRDCEEFRADQTIINLAMRKLFKKNLKIYNGKYIYAFDLNFSSKYGRGKHCNNQYLQYTRRSFESLNYISLKGSKNIKIFFNRLYFKIKAFFIFGYINFILELKNDIYSKLRKLFVEILFIIRYRNVLHIGNNHWTNIFAKTMHYPNSVSTKFGKDIIIKNILKKYFLKIDEEFLLIDIGCFKPIENSISYYFEKDFNVKVVGVDLNPYLGKLWSKLRHKSVFLNYLISDSDGEEFVSIYDFKSVFGRYSSALGEGFSRINNDFRICPKDIITKKIKRLSINNLMKRYKYNLNKIVIIDVECYLKKIIKSFDFKKCRPYLFIIHNNDKYSLGSNYIRDKLINNGYKFIVRFRNIYEIYIREDI